MLLKKSLHFCCKLVPSKKFIHLSSKKCENYENPIRRTLRVLSNDIKRLAASPTNNRVTALSRGLPNHVDVLIIGGGAIGSSIAYWLKEKTSKEGLRVVVVEKDTTYSKCSTALSVGGLRQQFSLPENIEMSLYGAEFIRTLKKRFGPNADVNFTPHGYLVLASEDGAAQLIENSKVQRRLGAVNTILTKDQIKERFPWMDVNDVELGCLGLEKEGWFDPWSLLTLFRNGAVKLGTTFVNGEVVDFTFEDRADFVVEGVTEGSYQALHQALVKTPDGELKTINFAMCIIAAGADSGQLARLAKIGTGPGMLSVPLPVEKRKRFVYVFNCQENPPGLNTPMTIDHTGMYFRRDGLGGSFICGMSPSPEEEPATDDLEVDHTFFDERIWPKLANRVPAFNSIKVVNSWSGFYEYNLYDENGIIGPHPYYHNMYVATGFSGHGIQQAPAVGRAVAELILDGNFQTIDLTRLGFDRLVVDKPMYEIGIY